MKKLMIGAMMAAIFMIGTQESFAASKKTTESKENTSAKKNFLTKFFKKKQKTEEEDFASAETSISKKNKVLTKAISEFKKANNTLRGKKKLRKERDKKNVSAIESLYDATDVFIAAFKKYFSDGVDIDGSLTAQAGAMAQHVSSIDLKKLSDKDQGYLKAWKEAFSKLIDILCKSDDIDDKTKESLSEKLKNISTTVDGKTENDDDDEAKKGDDDDESEED